MTVSVAPKSVKLAITKIPRPQTPTVDTTNANFNCTNISGAGEATLTGAAGDNPAAWTLGFIQAQWIETNWAYYRGEHDHDGSLFVQRARPPARPLQACRDCVGPASDIFYSISAGTGETASGAAGAAFPLRLTVSHYDKPGDLYPLVQQNTLTGKPNYLHEAQLEFSFCTVLSLRGPGGVFRHLSHFYWNVNWQATFPRTPAGVFGVSPLAGATFGNAQGPYDGAPNDPRFAGILTSAQGRNCNQVAAAETTGANIRQSARWADFNVTR